MASAAIQRGVNQTLPANKEGTNQAFLKRKEHICRTDCFPVTAVTFFCFVCDNEIFKPQVARHGRRINTATKEWETWYLCRDCLKAKLDETAEAREKMGDMTDRNWIKTATGPIKMGPQGVPSAKTLDQRKKKRRFL